MIIALTATFLARSADTLRSLRAIKIQLAEFAKKRKKRNVGFTNCAKTILEELL